MTADPTAPVFPLLLGMEWFSDTPGGLNRYFADLLANLATDGGEEAVAVALGPALDAPPNVHVVADHRASLPRRLVAFGRKAEQLAAVADVVDGHFAPYTFAALAFRRVRARPLVVHFQGPWAAETVSQSGPSPAAWVKRVIERSVYRRADAVVVLSRAFGDLVTSDYGVSPWAVRVIPPAVDLQRFHGGDRRAARRELELPDDAHVIGAVRRLVPRMGLEVLIDAFARIADERGILVLAGEGPESAALAKRAAELGVADRVRLLGRLSDEGLGAFYRAVDIVAVPSTSLEGFGLVVLESLASGTPVVATRVGGLPDALEDLDEHLLVEPDDAVSLAERLAQLRDDPSSAPTPEECRAHAECFDGKTLARRHRRLYREVASGRRPLRVVYMTHTAKPSGAELALVRTITALGDDVSPHVILGEDGPLIDELTEAGIRHHVLPLGASGELRRDRVGGFSAEQVTAGVATIGHVVRLARQLRRLRPDLVHTNSLKAAIYGGLAARLAGVPVIWHVHDRISSDYLPNPAVRGIRALARFIPRGIVANSEATLATLPRRGHQAVVGNAVVAGPRTERSAESPLTVGVVGRLAPWKGQTVFLEAFAKAFADRDTRGRLIGAPLFGEDDYERTLRECTRRLGLESRIEFRGHRRDMTAEYAELDIVVHSSVLPEPFGQVVVEAQAAGKAVVAAGAGGVLELIRDGEDGMLYPPGDVDALAAVLRRLADEPETRGRLGRNGLAARERFAPDRIAEQMLAVYERVCTGADEDRRRS